MALKIADFILETKITKTGKEAFFIKGLYYNYTGDKNKAILFFDKCLNLDYTDMFAYREKAIALYDMGRYDDAVTVLDIAFKLGKWLQNIYGKSFPKEVSDAEFTLPPKIDIRKAHSELEVKFTELEKALKQSIEKNQQLEIKLTD